MFYEMDSQIGRITLDNAVLGSIIKRAAAATGGRIILSDTKGKPIKPTSLKGSDDGGFFDVDWTNDGLDVEIYVVIKLGGSLNALAETMIENIFATIRALISITPSSITVIIKGIQAKNISGRDIRVTRCGNES